MDISSINAVSIENSLGETRESVKEKHYQGLMKATDKASLSNMLPRLQSILGAIDRPGDNVLESINGNIVNLQEAFVDSLYEVASANGVDLNQKLTIRLDEDERLCIIGEHSDKENIEKILAARPELSAAFKEISTQSELLRDVSNIGKIIGSQSGLSGYESAMSRSPASNYLLSLKGEMNHFYFSKA